MKKTAIILGATGLTGSLVLDQLLQNDDYQTVKLFSRRPCGVTHAKIEEYIVDVLDLRSSKSYFTADELFICIGTTKKKTPDRELYRKIDVGIPSTAVQIAKENNISKVAVVSAIGANANSSIEYNRIKGDMERAVLDLKIDKTYILRPSLIIGDRKEHRGGEGFAKVLFKLFNPIIPKKYKGVEAKTIASKMIELCNSEKPSCVLESHEIFV
jgi:uncharacterized protein YbjT (DUF2867 family)